MNFIDLFKIPELKKIKDLDNPLTASVHKTIIQEKPFLKRIYLDFYGEFKKTLTNCKKGLLVEIGSGSGFLKEVIPEVITSDVFEAQDIDMVFPATKVPFEDNSVSAFFLFDTLHHIDQPILFFNEAQRCLINGGRIVMIEPYCSLWGNFVYKFHHESLDKNANWEIKKRGRLTDANIALPWIIFFRDRSKFEKKFPDLKIKRLVPHTPFRYLVSGGLTFRQLLPSVSYDFVKWLEIILSPLNKHIGMFLTIKLEKSTRQ
ncbi:MAG: class I SAM-dependent methyltransferase [Candidatus Melainabacteria bacterium]|nr:class I SAM-dependent methyltransferase [Candidatus Melainabacteria bacterium]